VLIGVLASALLVPAAAAADPSLRAAVSPGDVVFGETRALTYRVVMRTGAAPERFELVAESGSAFGGEGTLLFPGREARLEGPGTLRTGSSFHTDVFPCSASDLPGRHGGLPFGQSFDLELPAEATSTLVFTATVARTAPWPGERFGLALQARNGFGAAPGTLAGDSEIPVPSPAPAGRTGVRLSLSTSPRAGFACETPPAVGDRPIDVVGRSDPPLAGQRVLLRYVPPGRRTPVTLASVPVADDGSFRYRGWRPRERGTYELAAAYVAQRPERADDFSVPRAFETARPAAGKVAPRMPPHAGVLSRRLVADRASRVRVRLACPAVAQIGCRDVLRLRRGSRLLARQAISLRPASRETVTLRLAPRARRLLRRGGRLAASADAGGPLYPVILSR